MARSTMNINSVLTSIEEISTSAIQFNIPRYQRLYVWTDEQIDTLLADILDAYKSERELFYLGGILTVASDHRANLFDLIDGQQRFTTLWLMSLEFGNSLSRFKTINEELRLRFSIRPAATQYFLNAQKDNNQAIIEEQTEKSGSSLSRIKNARDRINRFISKEFPERGDDFIQFADFVYKKVFLINTEVPKHTDLNKLFEVTNNRGVQLQHHEILKAQLLKHFSNREERIRYGKIWDACADMNNYIERNLAAEVGANISVSFDKWSKLFNIEPLFDLLKKKGRLASDIQLDLNAILSKNLTSVTENTSDDFELEHPDAEDTEQQPVRSILTFPQLLLHTLRIYQLKNKGSDIHKISEKELLYTFKEYGKIEDEKAAKKFIKLIFEVRTTFDLYFIKWVKVNDKEEVHQIKPIRKYNLPRKWTYYLQRQKPNNEDGFALLQSMLYHSQQITTHYWITPILLTALSDRDDKNLFSKLRRYDNLLFCTNDDRSLPEKTWSLMQDIINNDIPEIEGDLEVLDEDLGVDFPHYWFYKLEFILWHLLKDENPEWKNFRMTAKNSVEHVSPQNPAFIQDIVSEDYLNSFGNLALVSRGINSEFSNKPFREKRERFIYSKAERVDSLKLDLIYKHAFWNDVLCENHKNEMKKLVKQYFEINS